MGNAAYVDSASLNVIFRNDDGMVLGLDYSSNLQKLGIALQALGAGFSVYLTVWPRDVGDGAISQLSRSGYPFRVDTKELQAMLSFFSSIPGIGDLYICDGLANYIQAAKLATFESVFYIGRRLCHIKVENRLVVEHKIYANAQELSDSLGEDFNCYGDTDLVDVSRLRAAFQSLTYWEDAQIVGCAPMFMSARCADNYYLVDMAELVETVAVKQLEAEEAPEVQAPVAEVEPKEEARPSKKRKAQDDLELFKTNRFYVRPSDLKLYRVTADKPKGSVAVAVLTIIALTLSSLLGVVHASTDEWNSRADIAVQADKLAAVAEVDGLLADIYGKTLVNLDNFSQCIDVCRNNQLGVRVVGWDYQQGYFTVNCAAPTTELKDTFCAYVNSSYLVKQVNELGLSQGMDTFQLMLELN